MKGSLLGFLCFLFSMSLYGQSCDLVLKGIVMDEHTKEPVKEAKLYIKGSIVKTVSDSLGEFVLKGLCPGEIQLICLHHVGCEPYKIILNLSRDTNITLNTETHFLQLDEFELVKIVLDQSTLSKQRLSDLERFKTAGKTLGQQLESISGVRTLSTGNSIFKPVIHGLHSNRVLLLSNGVRQEGQQWGSEHAPEIDPFLNRDIAVIKGASALRYGPEAISGVVQINPPTWNKELGWHGDFYNGYNSNGRLFNSAFLLENNSKKVEGLHFRSHVSAKKGGNISAPNYVVANTGIEELNFSVSSFYKFRNQEFEVFYSRFSTELGIFSGSHIGNLSDLQAALQSNEPLVKSNFTYLIASPKQQISHDFIKTSWRAQWNKQLSSTVIYGFQKNNRREFDSHSSSFAASDAAIADFQLQLYTHSLDIVFDKKFTSKWQTQFGLQSSQQSNERAGRYLVPNYFKYQTGAFGILEFNSDKWKVDAGIRYDLVQLNTFLFENKLLIKPRHTFQHFSGSIGASRAFGHHFVLKANAGSAWRPPSVSELYSNGLHHGAAAIERGNRFMGKELSVQGNVAAIYKSKRLNLQMDVYHLHFLNFIYLKPQNELELTIKGAFPTFEYEEVAARFSGADLTADWLLTDQLKYRLKYSLVRAYNISEKNFLVGIPSDNLSNTLIYSVTNKKKGVFTAEMEWNYSFRQNRFSENADYTNPPSDYLLLNGSINYKLPIGTNTLQFGLTIDNALNKNYRNYMNRFRYYTDEIGRNIGIKVNYQF